MQYGFRFLHSFCHPQNLDLRSGANGLSVCRKRQRFYRTVTFGVLKDIECDPAGGPDSATSHGFGGIEVAGNITLVDQYPHHIFCDLYLSNDEGALGRGRFKTKCIR